MTGNNWMLSSVLPSTPNSVTFKDEGKGSVCGLGSLNDPSLPKLRDVLIVDG